MKLEVVDAEIAQCGAWLHRHVPGELVALTELVPRFMASSRSATAPASLDENGEVFVAEAR